MEVSCSRYATVSFFFYYTFLYIISGEKQWQATPKNLPRMQRTRAIPVAWLNSGLYPDRPKGWIPIIIIIIIIMYNLIDICKTQKNWGVLQATSFDVFPCVGYRATAFGSEHLQKQLQTSNVSAYTRQSYHNIIANFTFKQPGQDCRKIKSERVRERKMYYVTTLSFYNTVKPA